MAGLEQAYIRQLRSLYRIADKSWVECPVYALQIRYKCLYGATWEPHQAQWSHSYREPGQIRITAGVLARQFAIASSDWGH